MEEPTNEQIVHQLKNHLAVIVGFCDLLIAYTPEGDPRTADLLEVHKAARQAMAAMPQLADGRPRARLAEREGARVGGGAGDGAAGRRRRPQRSSTCRRT